MENAGLEKLFRQRRFFDLRDEIEKPDLSDSTELLFYRGVVANKFNRLEESNGLLQEYLEVGEPSAEKFISCYELLGDNYARSFQYDRAAVCFELLLERFAERFKREKRQNIEYLYNLWRAAGGIPPQRISFAGDTHLQTNRGKLGHLHIPLEIDGRSLEFIFDCGADVSSISASNAEKLGLPVIETEISVSGAAAVSKARLTCAPNVKFGNVTIENVVMLVIDDGDFYFAEHDYQIEGVFGYLSISACRQIAFDRNDEMFVPAVPVERIVGQNLLLDEMKPILRVEIDGAPATFFVDTGAGRTKFLPKFFELRKDEIVKTGKFGTGAMVGVGGGKDYPAYVCPEISFSAAGKLLRFEKAIVFTVPTFYQSEYHHGNLGQDWIGQFDQMTLDFDTLNLTFE